MFHRDPNPAVTRRQLLSRLGSGFGTLSLAGLLADEGMLCANETADQTGMVVSPLAPRPQHFPAKARWSFAGRHLRLQAADCTICWAASFRSRS